MSSVEKINRIIVVSTKALCLCLLIVIVVLQGPSLIKRAQVAYPDIFGQSGEGAVESDKNVPVKPSSEAFNLSPPKEHVHLQKSPDKCVIFNPFKDNPALAQSAFISIKKVVKSAILQGANLDELDLISYQTGFPIILARVGFMHAKDYDFMRKYPSETVPIFSDQNWLDNVSRESLRLTLEKNSVDQQTVINRVSSGVLKNDAIFVYNNTKSTLLGFLHDSVSWFSPDFIIDLLDAGYNLSLSDLAYMTTIGADQVVLEKLWHKVDGDVSSIHKFPPFYQSLASIALQHGNFDALIFWLERGSPINPDPFNASALTALLNAQKQNLFTSQEVKFIVKEIVKSKLKKEDISTIYAIYKDMLSTAEIETLRSNVIDSLAETKIVTQSVQKIKDIVLEPIAINSQNQECTNKFVKNSVAFILKKKFDKDRKEMSPNSQQISIPNNLQILLAEIVESKTEKESSKMEALKNRAEEIRESLEKELSNEDIINSQNVVAAAQKGDWALVLSLLDSIGVVSTDALTTLVSLAISTSTNTETLIELMELGGKLTQSSYLQLILNNNTKHVEALLPYGLNITESLLPDSDIVADVVKYGTPEMLALFLKHDVSIDFSIDGMDALDILLERFSLKGEDVVFLDVIMDTPVEVEASHLAFAHKLSKKSPTEFQYIAETYPELVAFEKIEQIQTR